MKLSKSIFVTSFSCLLLMACDSGDGIRGTQLPEMPFTDFTLTDQYGQPWFLSAHKGTPVLMFFGFTFCPDVCPLTLSTWKKVHSQLDDDSTKVAFVYITVDPDRDTAERLKRHLAVFSDAFIGLRGTDEQLKQVYSAFGVYREKVQIAEGAAGYTMNHTSSMYLLDKHGAWRIKHSNDARPEDIVHDLRLLLHEQHSNSNEHRDNS